MLPPPLPLPLTSLLPAALQAYESNYRWDENYRLNQDVMSKGSGLAVKHNLKKYAYDNAIDRFTRYGTEVLTVRQQPNGRWVDQ